MKIHEYQAVQIFKEAGIPVIVGRVASEIGEAVQIAREKEFPLGRLITHVFPAARFAEAVDVARHSREAIKVVLDWEAKRC